MSPIYGHNLMRRKLNCIEWVCLERAERARLREERQWLIMTGGDVSEEILQSLEKNGDDRDDEEDDDKKLDELDK